MQIRPLRLTSAVALAVAVGMTGCAKSDGAAKRQASGGGGDHSFEVTRDPPIAPDTRFAAGQLAESRGAFAQAAEQYRQALRNNPNHLGALYRLGVVNAEMKKFPEAIETWKKYAAATNDSAAAYSNLGFCYELARRPEEAESAYLKGIRKESTHVACRVNYGLMLVRRGRVGEGRLQLQAVLSEAEAHYNVGSVYESLGRREQAKAEYAKALALDPQFADAQARLSDLQKVGQSPSPAPATGVSRTE
jgi:tetratricopeptide (TPR) repeat protein